jgi:nicotinamidase-related amidase
MSWKTAYRSFYYADAEDPEDIRLVPGATALLVIDIQNTYLADKDTPEETARWQPFYGRMRETVIPNTARLIGECRARGVEVIYARIACLKKDGRDRSLSQKKPGFCSCRRTARTARWCPNWPPSPTTSPSSRRPTAR